MRVNISNLSSVLYIRSHLFRSTLSAVKLAEKNGSEKNMAFASKLLKVKNSLADAKLNQVTWYSGEKIKKSEKYAALSGRIDRLRDIQSSQGKPVVTAPSSVNWPGSNQFTEQKSNAQSQFSELQQLTEQLPYSTWKNVETERFRDIQTAVKTQIVTSEGKAMPANQIWVDNNKIAMRSQYPKTEYIEEHLQMLLDKKPAVLVVLSSDTDIAKRNFPPYFRQNNNYGNTSVTCQVKKMDILPAWIILN